MRPPVKIEALMDEWSKDCSIDADDPNMENTRIPKLHAKYLNILSYHNLLVKKLNSDYNSKKKIKLLYYTGKLNNPEDLEKYKLEPLYGKTYKHEISTYVEGDEELNQILLKRDLHEEIVRYCEYVMQEIKSRTFQVGNIIKYKMYQGGQ